MFKIFFFLICITSLILNANDLVYNGKFDSVFNDYPEGWINQFSGNAKIIENGAPENLGNSILFTKGYSLLRQDGLHLVAGEKYRMTVWVKTIDFKAKSNRIVLYAGAWADEIGFRKFPENTSWNKLEIEFNASSSKNNMYGLGILFDIQEGEIEVADLKVEPLTEIGKKNSYSSLIDKGRKIIPISILNPLNKKNILFKVPNEDNLKIEYEIDNIKATVNVRNQFKINVASLKNGIYKLHIKLLKNDKIVEKETYPINIVKKIKFDTSKHKRLNNLTVELANQKVVDNEIITFDNPRQGWVYFSLPKAGAEFENKTLNKAEISLFLDAGKFKIKIKGKGQAIVRAIPETFCYPLTGTAFPWSVNNDVNFVKKNAIPEVNVFMGYPPRLDLNQFNESRTVVMTNLSDKFGKVPLNSERLLKLFKKNKGVTNSCLGGFTLDEFGWSHYDDFRTLRDVFKNFSIDKRIYTWIAFPFPGITPNSADSISGLINIGEKGRGAILYEAYCTPMKNEKESWETLEKIMLTNSMKRLKHVFPEAENRIGFILSSCDTPFINIVEPNPIVDGKYFLDMQFYIMANNPVFKNLGIIGYWGVHYCTDEMLRWSYRLLRHYILEGNKDMLSKRYGFTFAPGHLKNCDFDNGLEDWQVTNNVSNGYSYRFGRVQQNRWRSNDVGDNFAIMIKEPQKVSTISQIATGLIPGKLYSLRYFTANKNDLDKKISKKADHGVRVVLDGIVPIKEKSYHHIATPRGKKVGLNYEQVIFRAINSNQEIEFNNKLSKDGSSIILNNIQLTPYYDEL